MTKVIFVIKVLILGASALVMSVLALAIVSYGNDERNLILNYILALLVALPLPGAAFILVLKKRSNSIKGKKNILLNVSEGVLFVTSLVLVSFLLFRFII